MREGKVKDHKGANVCSRQTSDFLDLDLRAKPSAWYKRRQADAGCCPWGSGRTGSRSWISHRSKEKVWW